MLLLKMSENRLVCLDGNAPVIAGMTDAKLSMVANNND